MKLLYLFVIGLALFTMQLSAQITIRGTISFKNEPIESATIYLNNTSIGTTTHMNGEFSLEVPEGLHQLIISYMGYKKIEYVLDTTLYNAPLVFELVEEEFVLDEVIVTKRRQDPERENYLALFTSAFIGLSKFSKYCVIENPEVLFFDYDRRNNHLTAEAYEPLIITNKALGYNIRYDLKYFSRQGNYIQYLGHTYFTPLKGNKVKQKRWQKNRLKAYRGSKIHFYKSVLTNTTKEEGFIIHQFKRRENTETKSSPAIKNQIRSDADAFNFISHVVARKRMPKYTDHLYNSNIPSTAIIAKAQDTTHLQFKDNIMVVYTKELEEENFILLGGKQRQPLPQSSNIFLISEKISINPTGTLLDPLAVIYEGYWSYEKFPYVLPLDYNPIKSLK